MLTRWFGAKVCVEGKQSIDPIDRHAQMLSNELRGLRRYPPVKMLRFLASTDNQFLCLLVVLRAIPFLQDTSEWLEIDLPASRFPFLHHPILSLIRGKYTQTGQHSASQAILTLESEEFWMFWLDRLVEERIREAQEAGAFRNLTGEGRPLPPDDGSPSEVWAAHRILKKNGLIPDWLQLRKEIYTERALVRQAWDEYWRAAEEFDRSDPGNVAILRRLAWRYRELARAVNKKIDLHNLRCPSLGHELVRFPEDMIEREWRRRGESPP